MTPIALFVLLAASPQPVHIGPSQPRSVNAPAATQVAPVPSMYPIRTPGLTLKARNPARIQTRTVLGRPVCVLGTDSHSRVWLQTNAATFLRGGAMCYVIDVPDERALRALQAVAGGVPLAAISGQVFVETGLKGYPALITQSGTVQ